MQLYFKEPFTIDEVLNILIICIEEGVKEKCLKKDVLSKVEHVADFPLEPKRGW